MYKTTRLHTRSQRGFTLIEVTVVILIMLVLTSLAIGIYGPFRSKQASDGAMEKVTMALHKARNNAVSTGYSFRVTIARQDNVFWVDRTGNTRAEQYAFDLRDQTEIDPITGETIQVGRPKVVRPEALPDFVEFSRINDDIPQDTLSGVDYYFFVFEPGGNSIDDGGIEFFTRGTDPNIDENYYSIRVYGPSGTIKKQPQQRLPQP